MEPTIRIASTGYPQRSIAWARDPSEPEDPDFEDDGRSGGGDDRDDDDDDGGGDDGGGSGGGGGGGGEREDEEDEEDEEDAGAGGGGGGASREEKTRPTEECQIVGDGRRRRRSRRRRRGDRDAQARVAANRPHDVRALHDVAGDLRHPRRLLSDRRQQGIFQRRDIPPRVRVAPARDPCGAFYTNAFHP